MNVHPVAICIFPRWNDK